MNGWNRYSRISLKYRADIQPQSPERVGVEPVRLPLGGAEEISDGGAAQSVEESKDSALLNHE